MTEQTLDNAPVLPGVGNIPTKVQAEFNTQGPLEKSTADDLAALEAQINAQVSPAKTEVVVPIPGTNEPPKVEAVTTPTPAAVVQPAVQTPVPQKFQNPDGSLNEEKLQKSTVNLERYLQMERELHAKHAQRNTAPATTPINNVPTENPAFAQRVAEDIQRDPAGTMIALFRASTEAAIQKNEEANRALARKLELMEIAQRDPEVFTEQGAKALEKTLDENPWLWNSPSPWASAYKMHGPITRQGQPPTAAVVTTQGTARPSAPILPGGGSAPPLNPGPVLSSEADLRRLLNERFAGNPQGQAEFLERIIANANRR